MPNFYDKHAWKERWQDLENWLFINNYTETLYYKTALDIGCGEGEITKQIAQYTSIVDAFDIRKEAIDLFTTDVKQPSNLRHLFVGNILTQKIPEYEAIFYLAVHQKLKTKAQRLTVLEKIFNSAKRTIFIRTLPEYSNQIITYATHHNFYVISPPSNFGQLSICHKLDIEDRGFKLT